ncbi:MAG: S1C family serine protease [Candidatus Altiarchaeota archaeon]
MKRMALFLLIFTLLGCSFHYYKSAAEIDISAVKNLVIIKTTGIVENSQQKVEQVGIGIPLKDGYILSPTHVTKIPRVTMVSTPFGCFSLDREIVDEHYFADGQEIELIGRLYDISLFKGNVKKVFPYKFGDSNKLEIGSKILLIGRSLNKSFNIKTGIVSMPESAPVDSDPFFRCFLSDNAVNPGDSGGPVLAYRNNQLEIVGIQIGKLSHSNFESEGMGVVFHINSVRLAIQKILGKECF